MIINYLEYFDGHQDLHGIHSHHHWTSNRNSFWGNFLGRPFFHSYECFSKTVAESLLFLKIPHCLI
jgi:hypothetical protein